MDRRSFLESSRTLAIGAFSAAGLTAILSGCSTIPQYTAAVSGLVAAVPKSVFDADDDSINIVIITIPGKSRPLALVSDGNGGVQCFVMRCTHKGCTLEAEPNGFSCPCHGSSFNVNGRVVTGPAVENLTPIAVDSRGPDYLIPLSVM
ncbi:MAG: Rieske 2Fe-2S domain-containing protein [Ignavibacteria bacterium]|nr:Rieske 2Fe-2S domain-containing protein [Ignavibacteria bacterium]